MIIKNSRKKRLGRVYVKSYHGPCVRKMYSTQSGKDGTKREREREKERKQINKMRNTNIGAGCVFVRACV